MANLILKSSGAAMFLGVVLLAGCVGRSAVPIPEVGGQIGDGYGQMILPQQHGQHLHTGYAQRPTKTHSSLIEGQLDDGDWIINVPGKAHTHSVVLAECPQQPVVVRHIHNDIQAEQLGKGPHKHKGCYICPPKNSLVKRVLGG